MLASQGHRVDDRIYGDVSEGIRTTRLPHLFRIGLARDDAHVHGARPTSLRLRQGRQGGERGQRLHHARLAGLGPFSGRDPRGEAPALRRRERPRIFGHGALGLLRYARHLEAVIIHLLPKHNDGHT